MFLRTVLGIARDNIIQLKDFVKEILGGRRHLLRRKNSGKVGGGSEWRKMRKNSN